METEQLSLKMIVTDLDGTLLRDDKTVSDRTWSALSRCRERGIKVVFATGRGLSATIVPFSPFDGYVVNNGAKAFAGDVPVYSRVIPIDAARNMLVSCDNAGIRIVAECDRHHYSNFDLPDDWPRLWKNRNTNFTELNIDADKIYALIDTSETVEFIKRCVPDMVYCSATRDGFVMVMHKEAIKSAAVASLANHWNINRSEIIAFGDDLNDIDLLEYSATGIAMGNAVCEVKMVADYVCDTNENDGLAKWLEDNLLNTTTSCGNCFT